jgi:hypothetical protein
MQSHSGASVLHDNSRHQIAEESRRAYAADVRRFLKFIEPSISMHDPTAWSCNGDARVAAYRRRPEQI